jgi:penicillin-binding protein 1B
MWAWLKTHRKKILLGAISAVVLAAAALGAWSYVLNDRISVALKTKKFLPPTEYFSAPEILHPRMNLSSQDLIHKLAQRKYSSRPWGEKLHPGEYAQGKIEECQNTVPSALPPESQSCFLLQTKESDDPEIGETGGLQMLVFGADQKPLLALRGNPLNAAESVLLEPLLVAQYLDKEPIQQNYTPLGEMPVACLDAVLAIEDAKFLDHSGVSLTGFARAAFRNLTGSRFTQGGSTITQQLVKNYFLTSERTYKRKATEFLMSLMLEMHSSKDEIFETYLNIIYLGQNGPFQIRGFPAASNYYFSQPIQNLELQDCALLAAVLNSPGMYDPFTKPINAWKRRNLVLDKMQEHGFISHNEAEQAKAKPLPTRAALNASETAPYYIDFVQRELQALSIPFDGKKIFTGLQLEAQVQAQKSVRDQLARLESDNKTVKALKAKGKTLEAVLMSADNRTGLVDAIVGGRSYKLTQFNRAFDGHRQVGSVMKPFVYLAALESSGVGGQKVYTPATLLNDTKTTHTYGKQSWSPENYGHEYFGDVPMYFALKKSLNSATASLGLEVGLQKIIDVAHVAGVESRMEPVPALTLGAFEMAPRETLQAYTTLANLGVKKPLRTIRYVLGENNALVYKSNSSQEQVIPVEPAAQLVSMMKQTILGGTAHQAYLQGITIPAAGKTGTTSDNKDSWFAGFTPYITTIVWVGYDDNTSHGLTGASGALPIWISYMKAEALIEPADDFAWPESLSKINFQNPTDDPKEAELLFVKGTEPQ